MKNSRASLIFAAIALGACSPQGDATVNQNDGATDAQSIIGGFAVGGKNLSAVGTVGMVDKDGKYQYICTATLIGPRTVLTAKHCAVFLDDGQTPAELVGANMVDYMRMAYAVGNANSPTKIYEAVAADVSPVSAGGLVGLGNDVAIYHLKDAVTEVTPIQYATKPINDTQLGQKAVSIGYGTQSNLQDWFPGDFAGDGSVKMGTTTLDALTGSFYALVFGSFDAFIANLRAQYGDAKVDECLADADCSKSLSDWYAGSALLKDYEVFTAKQAGDTVTCHGDSGGPLLAMVTNADGTRSRQILGVVSGGIGSKQLACDYGTVYATLGPKTEELITKALSWTDPCGDATIDGSCNGTTATRCTGKAEGPRRLSVLDCALVDQVCAKIDGEKVGCTDPTVAPTPQTPPQTPPAPTPAQVRAGVDRASRFIISPTAKAVVQRLSK